jgi:hypothetical protein
MYSTPAPDAAHGLPTPKTFGQLCLWGLALTWPMLLIGAVIVAVLLLKG